MAGPLVFGERFPFAHEGDTGTPGVLDEVAAAFDIFGEPSGGVLQPPRADQIVWFPADATVSSGELAISADRIEYGTTSIEVTHPAGERPVARDDFYFAEEAQPFTGAAAGVLANDAAPPGSALAAVLVDPSQLDASLLDWIASLWPAAGDD